MGAIVDVALHQPENVKQPKRPVVNWKGISKRDVSRDLRDLCEAEGESDQEAGK